MNKLLDTAAMRPSVSPKISSLSSAGFFVELEPGDGQPEILRDLPGTAQVSSEPTRPKPIRQAQLPEFL